MTLKEINKKLEYLNINKNKYYILGSASLVIRGLKKTSNDIDIAIALDEYNNLPDDIINDKKIDFIVKKNFEKSIEWYDKYYLQRLEDMLKNKKRRNLQKDQEDIKIIENELDYRKQVGEYVDLYDENKNKLNEVVFRKKGEKSIVPNNKYTIVVIAVIKNDNGYVLLQQASKRKNNIWGLPGGHTKIGQTSVEAILEELDEEMGIKFDNINLIKTYRYDDAFKDVYYIEKNIDINALRICKDEVEKVEFLSVEQIEDKITKNEFRKHNLDVFYDIIKK